jgi:hypothetical protein
VRVEAGQVQVARVQGLRHLRERQIRSLTPKRQQGIRSLQYFFSSRASSIVWMVDLIPIDLIDLHDRTIRPEPGGRYEGFTPYGIL